MNNATGVINLVIELLGTEDLTMTPLTDYVDKPYLDV